MRLHPGLWPVLCSVIDTHDFYECALNAVNDDVGKAGNDEFTRAWDSSGAAKVRKVSQTATTVVEPFSDSQGRGRVILLNATNDPVEIFGCRTRPAHAHSRTENLLQRFADRFVLDKFPAFSGGQA